MSEPIRHDRRRITLGLGAALGVSLVSAARVSAEPLLVTPAQVEGPFYPANKQADTDLDLTRVKGRTGAAIGEVILVRGLVQAADGRPLPNALVDVWQANHYGRYAHPEDPNPGPLDPDFQGWGVVSTDVNGRYEFRTIKPGPYSLEFLGGEGWRCRHIHFKVLCSGCRTAYHSDVLCGGSADRAGRGNCQSTSRSQDVADLRGATGSGEWSASVSLRCGAGASLIGPSRVRCSVY